MPAANAEISRPALGSETPRSPAMSGSRPATIISDVPCIRIAAPRSQITGGMALLAVLNHP
jgi:hypothetical protein